ncbi:M99 family carboxypeptidase catalytic domain-containing protein [Halocatena salina]|uniref:Succinylglutamate desuccinylase/aspartoacylase family protein n=1 Tax=Halocatena salina TaxID=2934340 RepID=A0A8U0A471_9EURY|nr:M99 family carboxypeptidase catalytic domain-containing protein [Halocatena salina]UPM43824.1 succinylglutamate desuccinylase/aspartoacylase family protein [Halocatena salina]
MKRRTYLSGAVAAVGLSMPTIRSPIDVSEQKKDTTGELEATATVLEGTKYETELYAIDGTDEGPTGIVVGGVHGDEKSGYRAAETVASWQFETGRVIVLPRVNRPAIERNTRHGVGGDLNRQFPPGETPTTKLARAIWNDVVMRYEPDVLLDLHRSKGIYKFHPDFVGQSIYPTNAGSAPSNAKETIDILNKEHVPWYMPFHEFKPGNTVYGSRPMLVHKAGNDLNIPAYIVETARFLTDLDTRIEWTTAAAESLLSLHDIGRAGKGEQ